MLSLLSWREVVMNICSTLTTQRASTGSVSTGCYQHVNADRLCRSFDSLARGAAGGCVSLRLHAKTLAYMGVRDSLMMDFAATNVDHLRDITSSSSQCSTTPKMIGCCSIHVLRPRWAEPRFMSVILSVCPFIGSLGRFKDVDFIYLDGRKRESNFYIEPTALSCHFHRPLTLSPPSTHPPLHFTHLNPLDPLICVVLHVFFSHSWRQCLLVIHCPL